MRDTARQLTDGLHLLALNKLRFERFEFCHVVQNRNQRTIRLAPRWVQGNLHKEILPIALAAQEFTGVEAARCRHITQPIRDRAP